MFPTRLKLISRRVWFVHRFAKKLHFCILPCGPHVPSTLMSPYASKGLPSKGTKPQFSIIIRIRGPLKIGGKTVARLAPGSVQMFSAVQTAEHVYRERTGCSEWYIGDSLMHGFRCWIGCFTLMGSSTFRFMCPKWSVWADSFLMCKTVDYQPPYFLR